jgi:hypothetical protein
MMVPIKRGVAEPARVSAGRGIVKPKSGKKREKLKL